MSSKRIAGGGGSSGGPNPEKESEENSYVSDSEDESDIEEYFNVHTSPSLNIRESRVTPWKCKQDAKKLIQNIERL